MKKLYVSLIVISLFVGAMPIHATSACGLSYEAQINTDVGDKYILFDGKDELGYIVMNFDDGKFRLFINASGGVNADFDTFEAALEAFCSTVK